MANVAAATTATARHRVHRGLGLYDSTMVVVGSMIGSGIFIVSADMARNVGSPGWLLVAWLLTGVLTVVGALSYGELAAMMPRAGGQYVYLREAFSPLWGFLYGWTLFLVIQTGTIAAVAVGFARYFGALVPWIADDHYLIAPIHLSTGYALSLSTTQLVGILMIALLTWTNTRGLEYGKHHPERLHDGEDRRAARADPRRRAARLEPRRRSPTTSATSGRARGTRRHRAGPDGGHRLRPVRRDLRLADRIALLRRRLEQHHVHGRRSEGPAAEHPAVARARHVRSSSACTCSPTSRISSRCRSTQIQHAPGDRVATATLERDLSRARRRRSWRSAS